MGKKFNGNIKLASAINRTGAQPLDDSVVVATVADLYNSFGATAYEGMMVCVLADHNIYVLTDVSKVSTAAGWKKIGDASSDISGAIAALDVTSNKSVSVAGIAVTVNQTDGKVQKPVVEVTAGSVASGNANVVTGGAVYTAINNALGSVYKVKGSYSTLDALEDGVAEANRKEGDVYNIEQGFTLANKKYPAGTNVVWVAEQTIGQLVTAAHWDALGGTIDLSNFATAAQGKLADTAMQGASGDSYISAVAGGIAGKTVTVTANVTKMADVKTGTVALADAADVKSYVDTKASAAASAGVTSLGGKTGAISVDSGKTTLGDVNFTISDDKKLTGSVAGIKSAAGKEASDFATAAQGAKADRAALMTTDADADNAYNEGKLVIGDSISENTTISKGKIELNNFDTDGTTAFGGSIEITNAGLKVAGLNGSDTTKITNVKDPTADQDAATKKYVDTAISNSVSDAMVWAEFA